MSEPTKPRRSIASRPSWVTEYLRRGDVATALRFASILPTRITPLDLEHLRTARAAVSAHIGAHARLVEIARHLDAAIARAEPAAPTPQESPPCRSTLPPRNAG